MRTLIAVVITLSAIAALAAEPPAPLKVRLDSVPIEFMGRWVASRVQCGSGGDRWLNIDRLHLTSYKEWAFIVSAWRVGTNQLELDLSLRNAVGESPTARYVRRFTLSADKHTLTDVSGGDGMIRVKCDD